MLEPCFNCLDMGHLWASCTNLPRQYPLSSVAKGVSVNELVKKNLGSKEMVESYNCIEGSGDNYPCKKLHNSDCNGSEPSGEDSSGLSRDLARCWEVEQEGPQIKDIQGLYLPM